MCKAEVCANAACLDGSLYKYAAREIADQLQGERETLQGHKTLKVDGLDQLLNSFHFLKEMIKEQPTYVSGYNR